MRDSLVGFLKPSSTTRLYCGRVPRLMSDNLRNRDLVKRIEGSRDRTISLF